MRVLRIDSSAQTESGISRHLTDRVIANILDQGALSGVTIRDLATEPLPQVDAAWVDANTTPVAERTEAQASVLALSETLVGEIEDADLLVIGTPVYNFSVPASLKLWIDQICRARRTFAYTENGPQGLMTGKSAIVCFVSGGTPFASDIDFASGYIRHILGFIGITDVHFAVADRRFMDDEAIARAEADVDRITRDLSARSANAA
ncbi:MAG: NAD(P)H-dependent oxidoreductase [Pseudomonadota bacterium]